MYGSARKRERKARRDYRYNLKKQRWRKIGLLDNIIGKQRHQQVSGRYEKKQKRPAGQRKTTPEVKRFKPREKPIKHWLRNLKVINLKDENRYCTKCKSNQIHSFTMKGTKIVQKCQKCGKER